MMILDDNNKVNYLQLLNSAITKEGTLSNCYALFHDYSLLNSIYVMLQLEARGLEVSPIKGFRAWNDLNRKVKKGQKALGVLFPIFGTYKKQEVQQDGTQKEIVIKYVKGFMEKHVHFAYSQTEILDKIKENKKIDLKNNDLHINIEKLCKDFDITIKPYDSINGNCQGYALTSKREIALNPIAENPVKTAIHEIAHVLLNHHDATYERNIKEVEAETVAYIVLSVCGVTENDLENSRAYIQSWLNGGEITEDVSKRIFQTADKILKQIKGDKVA